MTNAEQQTIEFQKHVNSFFGHRVVGAVAVVQDGNNAPKFEMASGCLTVIDDRLVWMTVSHFLQDVAKWKTDGTLKDLSLVYIIDNTIASSAAIDLSENPFFHMEEAESLDVGFMVLSSDFYDGIIKGNVKTIPKKNFGACDIERLGLIQLIGLSSEGSVLKNSVIHPYEKDGKQFGVNHTQLTDLQKRHVQLKKPETDPDNPLRRIAHPWRNDEKTVAGMSGGLIVGFIPGGELRGFRVLGIQSGEWNRENSNGKFMQRVWFFDATIAYNLIEEKILALSSPPPNA